MNLIATSHNISIPIEKIAYKILNFYTTQEKAACTVKVLSTVDSTRYEYFYYDSLEIYKDFDPTLYALALL